MTTIASQRNILNLTVHPTRSPPQILLNPCRLSSYRCIHQLLYSFVSLLPGLDRAWICMVSVCLFTSLELEQHSTKSFIYLNLDINERPARMANSSDTRLSQLPIADLMPSLHDCLRTLDHPDAWGSFPAPTSYFVGLIVITALGPKTATSSTNDIGSHILSHCSSRLRIPEDVALKPRKFDRTPR
jgi:hypothetical protein